MAQIDPWSIKLETECYAAVKWDIGFRCGRLNGWKLYDLKNPDLRVTLNQCPDDILAAFETQAELEQWREDLYKEPVPKLKNESPSLFDSAPASDREQAPEKSGQATLFDHSEVQDKHKLKREQATNLKFKIKQAEEFAPHLKAVNLKIRIDEGLVYFEANTKHTEPWPFTSLLFQQMIEQGAVLGHREDHLAEDFTLYADRSKKVELASSLSFIALLGLLADRQYRLNMQKEHEASLDPSLVYISKGNPEKKQPPFILSQIL